MSQTTPTAQPTLDPRAEEIARACQAAVEELLQRFPELRTISLVLDYTVRHLGWPSFVSIAARPLSPEESRDMLAAMDSASLELRRRHDAALINLLMELTKNGSERQK